MENGNKSPFKDETADDYRLRISKFDPWVNHNDMGAGRVEEIKALSPRGRLIVVGMAAAQVKFRRLTKPPWWRRIIGIDA